LGGLWALPTVLGGLWALDIFNFLSSIKTVGVSFGRFVGVRVGVAFLGQSIGIDEENISVNIFILALKL